MPPSLPTLLRRLGVALLLTTAACGLDPASGDHPPVADGYFPAAVGTRWTYMVDETSLGTRDTVHMAVVGRVVTAQGPIAGATIWTVRRHDIVDSFIVRCDGATVEALPLPGSDRILPFDRLQLPLTPGRHWSYGRDSRDSVVSSPLLFVHASGRRVDVRTVQGSWHADWSSGTRDLSIVPGLGIIRLRMTTEPVGQAPGRDETWQLIDPPLAHWPAH